MNNTEKYIVAITKVDIEVCMMFPRSCPLQKFGEHTHLTGSVRWIVWPT